MTEPGSIILKMYNRWMIASVLSDVLLALGFTLVVTALLNNQFQPTWWLDGYIFFMAMIGLSVRSNYHNLHPADFARHLNSRMPQFQESAQLLLKPVASQTMLEKLQTSRVEHAIAQKPIAFLPGKKLRWSAALLLVSILLAKSLYPLPHFLRLSKPGALTKAAITAKNKVAEKKMAGIHSVDVQVTPPAYTGVGSMHQSSYTIQTPEGSDAFWQLATNMAVGQVQLVFNDKEAVAMRAADSSHTRWTLLKKLTGSGFYQVRLEGKRSDMYMIDLVKDQPPQVRILRPKQYTTIGFGEPQRLGINASAQDDYGLNGAFITATVASGSGEAVKFKEQRLLLSGQLAGRRETTLQHALDLRALGMKPGDELYYFVSVTDNHAQETRSDVYTIVLPDTAELMEIEGLTNSVNLKQEYFRSQRQIIIETEQLLKDRDTISSAVFNNKSNNLGIDQKLLRLRYGKFLGEENENEEEEEREHGEEEQGQTVFGDATKLMQHYTHQHDNAEDASFFDPKQKAQLRATLSEMWKAELQLRLYKPQQALPFEYKALLLLKDLQQQSRSYVAKAAYKTTPLRPEKRLTADLSKIVQPVTRQTTKAADEKEKILQDAAGFLEGLKQLTRPAPTAAKTLQAAAQQLGTGAISKPATYLSSFEAIKRILRLLDHPEEISPKDISMAEKGLQNLSNKSVKSPRKERAGTPQSLSQQYFTNLQQTNR